MFREHFSREEFVARFYCMTKVMIMSCHCATKPIFRAYVSVTRFPNITCMFGHTLFERSACHPDIVSPTMYAFDLIHYIVVTARGPVIWVTIETRFGTKGARFAVRVD
jgi:hypothetical protein